MSRKIVGLDIGSHSIKVVVARERLGKIDLLNFVETPVSGDNLQEIIRSVFRENGLHPDVVVSSVSGNTVSVHYIRIPFSDEAKISQVIPYEVESLVPFPLEEMVIDQFIVSKGNGTPTGNGSAVCVALIRKDALQQHISTLKEAYIDPRVIELESLALYHTFVQWYKTEDTVALLDIGASRSNLCIVSGNKPMLVRTFNRGGFEITHFLQDSLGVSFEEAEGKKISAGVADEEPSGSNGETAEISSIIKKGLSPLIIELRQSLHAYETQQKDPVTRLYIAGGGSLLRNIDTLLSRELGVEVNYLSLPYEMLQNIPNGEVVSSSLSTGVGLALRGTHKKKAMGLNFRKGEYFHKKEAKETTWKYFYLLMVIIAVAFLGSLDFYSRYHYKEARYLSIKSEIRNIYMETFPDARNIVDEVQQLKSAVDELRKKVAALGGGSSRQLSSLDLLKTMTEKIPKDIVLNVDDLVIDKTKIRVQGNTDSFENVERLKREFESIPLFRKVDVSDAKLSADQQKVKFRIIIDL